MTGRELYERYLRAMEAATTDEQDTWEELNPVTRSCWDEFAAGLDEVEQLDPLEREVFVKARVSLDSVAQAVEALSDWAELICGYGYVETRELSDDENSVTYWCQFESDDGDEMHARDRARETMQELEASSNSSVTWYYVKRDEVPR